MITKSYLKECLSYDPETGVFIWKERPSYHFKTARAASVINSRQRGKVAGSVHKAKPDAAPYLIISISGVRYRAHHLAWLYVFGAFPDYEIDHIDGNTLNNRILNIRDVTRPDNNKNRSLPTNNKSGVIGVSWDKRVSRWVAGIKISGKRIFLGYFADLEDAALARKAAEEKYGFHRNHGREMCCR